MQLSSIDARLAGALATVELSDMAERARRGHYSDLRSPLALPKMTLCSELASIGTQDALRLRSRIMMGDFDD